MKFAIGKERDREYMAAVERGDMEAALEESRKEGDKKRPSEDGKVAFTLKQMKLGILTLKNKRIA